MERTLILLKPDAIERGLIGEILRRIEATGLRIQRIATVEATEAKLRAHYADLEERLPVIAERNRKWMANRNVIAVEVSGRNAVGIVRKLTGVTSPTAAAPGTLRGDLSCDSAELANLEERTTQNLLHSAESQACAEAEIEIWFGATKG